VSRAVRVTILIKKSKKSKRLGVGETFAAHHPYPQAGTALFPYLFAYYPTIPETPVMAAAFAGQPGGILAGAGGVDGGALPAGGIPVGGIPAGGIPVGGIPAGGGGVVGGALSGRYP
jgi:hypothetical protein